MCERCSLRWKAEIFVSPDTRLAAAVLRQSWWGSIVGRGLVWGWVGGWSCLWVHEWDVCGFKGSFCSQAMLKVIYWIWSSYFWKDIEINVWYKMLPDCLIAFIYTVTGSNTTHFSCLLPHRCCLQKPSEYTKCSLQQSTVQNWLWPICSFPIKTVGHFKKKFITNLVNENIQQYGTSVHHSDNTVIINDTLCVHPSKHKGQSYCLWGCWAASLLFTSITLNTHLPWQ